MGSRKCEIGCVCGRHSEAHRARARIAGTYERTETSKQRSADSKRIHGGSGSRLVGRIKDPTYVVWDNMKQRCYNPNRADYKNWGGRGIEVCQRWLESFENFLEDMGRRPDGMTIQRIDNDGDYEPGNCCWATWFDQAANHRKRSTA